MAHGENAERGGRPGKEFWSRRPYSTMGLGRWLKTMCHRAERRLGRKEINEQLREALIQPSEEERHGDD